jgi:hypothetical protein
MQYAQRELSSPASAHVAVTVAIAPCAVNVQAPRFMGDDGLKMRSMWWKRAGRSRSVMSSGAHGSMVAKDTYWAVRDNCSRRSPPANRASVPSTNAPDEMPPR